MTVGNKSGMAGGSVPLYGESIIKQQSTSTDVLTIQFASGTPSGSSAGRGLVIRTFVGGDSPAPATGAEIFSVDYAGNVYAKGGITIGTSGAAIPVTAISTLTGETGATAAGVGGWGSTTMALTLADAGKILVVPTCSAAGGVVTLPISSGVPLGTTFKLYFPAAANSSGIRISSTLNSSDDVRLPSGATGEVFQVTATGLQKNAYIEIVNISSLGQWLGLPGGSTAAAWSATAAAA